LREPYQPSSNSPLSAGETKPVALDENGRKRSPVAIRHSRNEAAAAASDIDVADFLQENEEQWTAERNRREREMDPVSDEMLEEVKLLLQLFGVPYVDAPAEAEAQCAALEALGLVDGIVTEDSDVFVFGGKTVYKNIFDEQKYVEVYAARDAEREMRLTTNSMVALAMLLGGDYTEGVKGVGIVNAMEVLETFDVSTDLKSGLTSFKKWLDGFDPGYVLALKNAEDCVSSKEQLFHSKHRTARTRWIAPENFPSDSVMKAYTDPVVDKSKDRFSWGSKFACRIFFDVMLTFCL
jgi:DNA excision repair protein ERCC-5